MLRIGICDDEAAARDSLRFQLENTLNEKTEKIVYEFSSGRNAVRWLNNHPGEIDLLFLDVEMPEKNGMETAREIRSFDSRLFIVFVTGYTDYVFDGYQVGAFDYMVKPVRSDSLSRLLTRIREKMKEKESDFFTFHNQEGTFRFPISDILYFYSEKRLVYLVTAKAEYPFYEKLDCLEERLSGRFVRIHQRWLINPEHITCIGSNSVTIGERKLPISRSLKDAASRKLAQALLESD